MSERELQVECETYNVTRQGMCLALLDLRGECPKQGEHGDEFDRPLR